MPIPDISVCMIVKNEALHLERCLDSVQGLVSEIIIADTGSEDNSIDIAFSFGATVIRMPWDDNFAEARNLVLRQASCPWILVLDADEAAHKWTQDEVNTLLQAEQVHGYFLSFVHFVGRAAGENYVTDQVCRLFRNDERIFFQGNIHEEVASSIWQLPGGNISYTPLRIHHYGYLEDVLQRKNKISRNLALITAALRLEPDSLPLLYALGAEYYQDGKYGAAADILVPLLEKAPVKSGYTSDLFLKAAFALQRSGQMEEADKVFRAGADLFPDFTELLESYAVLLMEQGEPEKAYAMLGQALACGDVSHKYPSSSGCGTYRTNLLAGKICEKRFRHLEALVHYEKAVQFSANDMKAWKELVPLCLLSGETARLMELTLRNISLLSSQTLRVLAPAALNSRIPQWLAILCEAPQMPLSVQATMRVLLEIIGQEATGGQATASLESLIDAQPQLDQSFITGYLWAWSLRKEDMAAARRLLPLLEPARPGFIALQQRLEGDTEVPVSPTDLAYAAQLLVQTGAWNLLLALYRHSDSLSFEWCKLPQSLLYGLLHAPVSVKRQWCPLYTRKEHHYSTSADSAEWLLYAAMSYSSGGAPVLEAKTGDALRQSGGAAAAIGLAYHWLHSAKAFSDGVPSGSIPWPLLVRSAILS